MSDLPKVGEEATVVAPFKIKVTKIEMTGEGIYVTGNHGNGWVRVPVEVVG